MKLYDLADADDLQVVSERMWEIVQQHKPLLKKVINEVTADKRLDREDIIHAGFIMGAAFAMGEMLHGNIRGTGRG